MLRRQVSDDSLLSLSRAGLEGLKAQFRRNLPVWARLAKENERLMFENLRQQFSARSSFKTAHMT